MPTNNLHLTPAERCPRVAARIECPECDYPASHALQALDDVEIDPGHVGATPTEAPNA